MVQIGQVLEERGTRYGEFKTQAIIAQSMHIVLEQGMKVAGKTRFDFAPDQLEAINMIFNKLGRIVNGDPNYSDSWRDIAGYATLVADRLDNDTQQREHEAKMKEQYERNRDPREIEANISNNEPSQARRDIGQEENTAAERPSRPTGRFELRRMPVRLVVQDGNHITPTKTEPGVPVQPGQ